ncbi:MAG TPA: hypothetical protein VFZ65_22465 [Planctomycetota bacterium]|nr:hypothetical protein [Planctomycetota bacterium]
MSERTRRVRRSLRALALAPLAALSGCLTGALWGGYAWPEPTMVEQLADRRTTQVAGTLVESRPVLENGLWWCDDQHAPGRWWLRPHIGAGAEFVAALLADPEFCEVQSATVEALRSYAANEVLGDDAVLDLELRLRTEAIGSAVRAADVSPDAARVLATVRPNAYLRAAGPGAELPVVYRQCAERLSAVDLRRLVGAPIAVHAEAWVFVDAEGRPAFGGATDGAVLPEAADDEEAPLADRLAALRELSLLVRVHRDGAPVFLRLRPDRVWLSSGLHVDGERCTHRSSWYLQAAPAPLAAAPARDALRIDSTMLVQEDRYDRSFHAVVLDSGFLVKAVLTPVTLALDLVFGPGLGDFLRWISGKGPEPSHPQKGN